MLRFRVFLSVLPVLLTLQSVSLTIAQENDNGPDSDFSFYDACVNGKMDILQNAMETNPQWVHKATADGEHCLHLAAIQGQPEVTAYMLKQGADPNVRTTFAAGLRMHPLSWNVYAGHYESVKVLLDGGADINLDFDDMGENPNKVTVLDVSTRLVKADKAKGDDNKEDRFDITHQLLINRGAKLYDEVIASQWNRATSSCLYDDDDDDDNGQRSLKVWRSGDPELPFMYTTRYTHH